MAVKLQSGGGPVSVSVTGPGLDHWLTVRTGADDVAAGEPLVVDLRFEPAEEGTEASGTLEVEGVGAFRVFAVADAGEPGIWGLSEAGCNLVADRMARGQVASVLHEARVRTTPAG
jgi:hypothetical protein